MSGGELVIGGLTGLHAATWGVYKDSPFEGFRPGSFLRSLALGVAVGLVVGAVAEDAPLLLLVGLVYAGERLLTEGW